MLKRPITYVDFNGDTRTEEFYFNLSKAELIRFEAKYDGGLHQGLLKIAQSGDNKKLLDAFEDIILSSYGEKSEDGTRFVKTAQVREDFSQSAAYDALFTEMCANEQVMLTFLTGVVPEEMRKAILAGQGRDQDKPIGPPPARRPPMPPTTR